jgi:hypothetical protein
MRARLWRSMGLKRSHSALGGARATDVSVMVLEPKSTICSNDTSPAIALGRALPALRIQTLTRLHVRVKPLPLEATNWYPDSQ